MKISYNKKKDSPPFYTNIKLLNLLADLSKKPKITFLGEDVTHSCHVWLENTLFKSNGKGVSKEYALASGLAELLERIQWEIAVSTDEVTNNDDIAKIELSDFINRKVSCVDEKFFDFLFCKDINRTMAEVLPPEELLKLFRIKNTEKIKCSKFYNLNKKEVQYLPTATLGYSTSNGLCAGNTFEEAAVEGISEIVERYAFQKIIFNNLVCPDIPKSEYSKYKIITDLIDFFKKLGFQIRIKDASLGENYPAVCLTLIDRETGKYSIHFGAHPILPIAIERCFTEIVQGSDLSKEAIMAKPIWRNPEVNSTFNDFSDEEIRDFLVVAYSFVNVDFFTGKPHWEYDKNTWKASFNMSNKELLKNLCDLIMKKSCEIYIKDVTFLGFNAYQIFIPQMSNMYWHNSNNTVLKMLQKKILKDKPRKIIDIKTALECMGSPYAFVISLMDNIKKKSYKKAIKNIEEIFEEKIESDFIDNRELQCLKNYLTLLDKNCEIEQIHTYLAEFYGKNMLKKIEKKWIKQSESIETLKAYKDAQKIVKKHKLFIKELKKRYKENTPIQENMIGFFKELGI